MLKWLYDGKLLNKDMQMKKLMLAVLAVAVMSTASFAGWGAAAKLGVGENDPKTLKDAHDTWGGDLDEGYGIFSLEGLYEMPFAADEANKVGVKLGIDFYGSNEWKVTGNKVTEDTYAFPLTVYYKRDNGVKNVSFWAGPGVTFIRTEVDATGTLFGTEKDHKNKTFFHIAGGAEYRFTQLFALGLDVRYNFSAKIKKDGYVSDRSGFGGAVAARFYF